MTCNHKGSDCICETLKEIVKAQASVDNHDCETSCEKSLLLGPASDLNTIPILLICKGDCDYFIGSGIFKHEGTAILKCFKTPLLRVSKVKEDKNECCVELELLQAQTETGTVPTSGDDVCNFFADNTIQKIIRTGICIKVDISCFCGIECLAAVNAQREKPVSPLPPRKTKIVQEELCGNFGPGTHTVWESLTGNVVQGSFQIYNSAESTSPVDGSVTGDPSIVFPPVQPGNTITRSTNSPTSFTIVGPEGTHGKYCLDLIKEIQVSGQSTDSC